MRTLLAQDVLEILVFCIGRQRYGVNLQDVEQVVRAVPATPLPRAPPVIEGVINLHGSAVAVLDVRARFGAHPKPVSVEDVLIVARAGDRRVAVRADRTDGLAKVDRAEVHDAAAVTSKATYVAGVVTLPEGIVLIHDLRTFLTESEDAEIGLLMTESLGS